MTELNKDSLLIFFKEPTLENFKSFLKNNIGEINEVDFKANWVDIDKTAQIILGIANCGGGCIVIGVSENAGELRADGISSSEIKYDPADFTKKVSKYIPKYILPNIKLLNFFYGDDVYGELKSKKFQVILVTVEKEDLPVICASDGSAVKRGDIYIRRGTSTERINYEELQLIIDNSVNAKSAKINSMVFKEELEQLQALHDAFPKPSYGLSSPRPAWLYQQKNTVHPKRSFEDFLVEMIKYKEKKIEGLIK